VTSKIPEDLLYERACVIPLALSTAASGLFMKHFLALPKPTLTEESRNAVVNIWEGSTSVGSNAVQLAQRAGYKVIAMASPKDFENT
jgi:NADPH:quinone reductase-like Zn-dependent oxidoreductase